jgi:uncharacterized protein YjbK
MMSQEVEIEVKSMLTKEAYNTLLKGFHLLESDAIIQYNHYFETPNFALKNTGSGLRIREKNGSYTLTLKQPYKVGKLETHQSISYEAWQTAQQKSILPAGNVMNQLLKLEIPVEQLEFVGTLTTNRIEIKYEDGILCFDKSYYFDQIDYEIEFEGTSEQHAASTLSKLLSGYDLSQIATENKVRRFFKQKNKQDNNL